MENINDAAELGAVNMSTSSKLGMPLSERKDSRQNKSHEVENRMDYVVFETTKMVFGEMAKEKAIDEFEDGAHLGNDEDYRVELAQVKRFIHELSLCRWLPADGVLHPGEISVCVAPINVVAASLM